MRLMKSILSRRVAVMFCAGVLGATPLTANADAAASYPERSVTIIVPFAPGGAADLLARHISKILSGTFGQSFVVENKAGAGGTIGARHVARAQPDGYTLVMGTNASHAISAATYNNLPYDPLKDFAPISLVAFVPQALMVHPSLPIKNVQDLIEYARKNPQDMNFGSAGNGTPGHLGMELFKMMTNTDMAHVPFKGGSPDLLASAGGQVQVVADNMNSALPQIQAGTVRPSAVTSITRSQALPDMPTIDEQGVKGFDSGSWFALYAPAGTPPAIVSKLNAEIIKALNEPQISEMLAAQGAEARPGPPSELTDLMRTDIAKWKDVADRIGYKVD